MLVFPYTNGTDNLSHATNHVEESGHASFIVANIEMASTAVVPVFPGTKGTDNLSHVRNPVEESGHASFTVANMEMMTTALRFCSIFRETNILTVV
jgi:hypothetical protein